MSKHIDIDDLLFQIVKSSRNQSGWSDYSGVVSKVINDQIMGSSGIDCGNTLKLALKKPELFITRMVGDAKQIKPMNGCVVGGDDGTLESAFVELWGVECTSDLNILKELGVSSGVFKDLTRMVRHRVLIGSGLERILVILAERYFDLVVRCKKKGVLLTEFISGLGGFDVSEFEVLIKDRLKTSEGVVF